MKPTRTKSLAACAGIAAVQHGAIARSQALDAGLSPDAVDRLTANGTWTIVRPSVYALWVPRERTPLLKHKLSVAALWLGSRGAISRRAAAFVWGLDGIDRVPLELVTIGRQRASAPDLVIHHVASLDAGDVTVRDGIRVTTVPRTLVELARVVGDQSLELAFESAVRKGLTTVADVEAAIARSPLNHPARRALAEVLKAATTSTDSALEVLLWRASRTGRLPAPVPQYTIRVEGGYKIATVDFAYLESRVAVEADGFEFHSSSSAFRRDRRRQNALMAAGWYPYRTTWADVARRSDLVIAELAEIIGKRCDRPVAP